MERGANAKHRQSEDFSAATTKVEQCNPPDGNIATERPPEPKEELLDPPQYLQLGRRDHETYHQSQL